MAKTAVTQLEEQIDAIRQEAYAAGYAAAMKAIRDLADGSSGVASTRVRRSPTPSGRTQKSRLPKGRSHRAAATAPTAPSRPQRPRPQRGSNALLIVEVLKGMTHAARAAEIRKAVQRDKGVSISFPSIRHALDQLARRGDVEASADRRSWHLLGRPATDLQGALDFI